MTDLYDPASDPERPAPSRVLLRGGVIHSPEEPFATAMLVEDGRITWLGSDSAAGVAHADSVDEIVELRGALVTPAFVDAHVHTTSTGLAMAGLNLSGERSLAEMLDRVASFSGSVPAGAMVIAQGWDETKWPERRPPTPAELDSAVGGRPAYLSRTDVHSALVSSALIAQLPAIRGAAGFRDSGHVTQEAHHIARRAAFELLGPGQRGAFQAYALRRAAQLGIGAVHECGGPTISSEDDFRQLLELAGSGPGPEVFGYWAELGAVDKALALGAVGAAGDLFVDGALGSHTACLTHPYLDAEPVDGKVTSGVGYLTAEQIGAHVAACTRAGVQAGFHAIGDAALADLLAGFGLAAAEVGLAEVARIGHRVEHVELPPPGMVDGFLKYGLIASVQPAFDAEWGGPEGMYAERLGVERALTMNPYADLQRAGVPLAFGSDAPVTPLDPWGTVRAAAFHLTPEHRISVRAAFTAHTRGGWRAVGRDQDGVLVPGAVASYAVWDTAELVVQAPDDRVAGWSTDPRSGTPGLPDLTPGVDLPRCLRTVVRGKLAHLG